MAVYYRELKTGHCWMVDVQIGEGERINQILTDVCTKAGAVAAQEKLRAEYRSR